MALELSTAAASASPVEKARLGEFELLLRGLCSFLGEYRERKQDELRLLCEEEPKITALRECPHFVDVAAEMPRPFEAELRDLFHRGDDSGGFLVCEVIEELFDRTPPFRRPIVSPA